MKSFVPAAKLQRISIGGGLSSGLVLVAVLAAIAKVACYLLCATWEFEVHTCRQIDLYYVFLIARCLASQAAYKIHNGMRKQMCNVLGNDTQKSSKLLYDHNYN